MPPPRCRSGSGHVTPLSSSSGVGRDHDGQDRQQHPEHRQRHDTASAGRAAGRRENQRQDHGGEEQPDVPDPAAHPAPPRPARQARRGRVDRAEDGGHERRARSPASASRRGSPARGWPPWRRPRRSRGTACQGPPRPAVAGDTTSQAVPSVRQRRARTASRRARSTSRCAHGALRSHRDTWAGCIVVDTTPRRSLPRASRSSSWRSCAEKTRVCASRRSASGRTFGRRLAGSWRAGAEQPGDGKGRGGDGEVGLAGQRLQQEAQADHEPDVRRGEQHGERAVDQGPVDDDVDVVEPVPQDRGADGKREPDHDGHEAVTQPMPPITADHAGCGPRQRLAERSRAGRS